MVIGQEADSTGYHFEESSEEVVFHRPTTPYQALKLLPRNATPSQQDSIVQVYCKPVIVAPSNRPDTLGLPGRKGKIYNLQDIPTYKDGFFAHNENLHSELRLTFSGIAGDPVPYRLRNDVLITSTLLICFFGVLFIISRYLHVLYVQLKYLFYNRDHNETVLLNRDSEIKSQLFTNILCSFLLAIMFLHYTEYTLPDVFNRTSPYKILLLDMLVCIVYFITKDIAYKLTNWTFFSKQNNEQWSNSYHLLTLLKTTGYFILTLVIVYFDLSIELSIWVYLILIFTFELLFTYKTKQIFFAYKLGSFHLFLYLCTLEILPLFFLWWSLIEANKFTIVFI